MKNFITKLLPLGYLFIFSFCYGQSAGEQIKHSIAIQKERLVKACSDQEKSQILFELALAYFHDQELDCAFETFLEALNHVEMRPSVEMSDAEKKIYDLALEEYLSNTCQDPQIAAETLISKYGAIAGEHPDYMSLNFLMTTAYANLGKYEKFFDAFFQAYPFMHDTFIAYKTQGILYLRLSQRKQNKLEQVKFQKAAIEQLSKALTKNPQEVSIYRILVLLAKDEGNPSLLLSYLKKMVECRAPIPRSDIHFYVCEAVALGEFDLAQAIIDHGKALYEFSRAVMAAQQYLNQNKSTEFNG